LQYLTSILTCLETSSPLLIALGTSAAGVVIVMVVLLPVVRREKEREISTTVPALNVMNRPKRWQSIIG
jgi:hypothetical protein